MISYDIIYAYTLGEGEESMMNGGVSKLIEIRTRVDVWIDYLHFQPTPKAYQLYSLITHIFSNSPDSPDNPERVRDRRLDRKIVLKVMSWVEPFYFVAYRRTFNVLC